MIKERTSDKIYSNILVFVDRPVPYPVDRPYPVQTEKLIPGEPIKFVFLATFLFNNYISFCNLVKIEKKVPYAVPIAGKSHKSHIISAPRYNYISHKFFIFKNSMLCFYNMPYCEMTV